MNTDDLRTKYGKVIHFNCKDGDEAFTDGYVLWLEKKLLLCDVSIAKRTVYCECSQRSLMKPISPTEYECFDCGKEVKQ